MVRAADPPRESGCFMFAVGTGGPSIQIRPKSLAIIADSAFHISDRGL
jgi:hypothetical protein